MPQFKLPGFGQEQVEAQGGEFKPYDGPLPPKNKRVRVKIKQFKIKINKSGNPMFTCLAEIAAPKSHPMAQYNGAAAWWNGNLTQQGAGYVNDFLQAIAGSATLGKKLSEAVWVGKHGGMRLVGAKEPTKDGVLMAAIGTVAFKADKDTFAEIITAHEKVKQGANKGEIVLRVGAWVLPKAVERTPDEEDEDEADDYADDVDQEDGVEVEEDEDSEDVEEDEDDADEDDESDADEDEDGSEGFTKEPPF